MNARKKDIAGLLLEHLKQSFNDKSLAIGHGIALDNDKNASYYIKVHCDTQHLQPVETAADAFLKAQCQGEPVILRTTDLQSAEHPNKDLYDLGIGHVGAVIRSKR